MSKTKPLDGADGGSNPSSHSTKKAELPLSAAIYPAIKCADPKVFDELLLRLNEWQAEPLNWITDFRRIGGYWTGSFPANFCATIPKMMDWETVKAHLVNENGIPSSQLKDTRIALLRAKWFFNLTLDRNSVLELFPVAQRNPAHHNFLSRALLRVATDGEIPILLRMLYWVMFQIRTPEFRTLNRNSTWERQAFWFKNLDPISTVWLLECLDSAIHFEWLIDAMAPFSVGQYSGEDKALARDVWHVIRMRLVYAAEAVFIHCVDAVPSQGMRFPVGGIGMVAERGFWKLTLDGFVGAQNVDVPVEKWPVKALDVENREVEIGMGRLSGW